MIGNWLFRLKVISTISTCSSSTITTTSYSLLLQIGLSNAMKFRTISSTDVCYNDYNEH